MLKLSAQSIQKIVFGILFFMPVMREEMSTGELQPLGEQGPHSVKPKGLLSVARLSYPDTFWALEEAKGSAVVMVDVGAPVGSVARDGEPGAINPKKTAREKKWIFRLIISSDILWIHGVREAVKLK